MIKLKPKSVSLIVSTYNWESALNLVLESATQQSRPLDEILVADDGSREPTRELVSAWQQKSPVPIRHIWQEDDGFQLSRIRNKAIAAATSDYIISVDGDMVLERHFVEDHANAATADCFVQGGRVGVGKHTTEKMLAGAKIKMSPFTPDIGNRKNTIRALWLSKLILTHKSRSMVRIRGCNQAFWRQDLIKINGFNEAMVGWGREDSDLFIRLINAGLMRKNIKFSGLAYHLHHNEASRDRVNTNDDILQESITNKKVRCEKGINQHL